MSDEYEDDFDRTETCFLALCRPALFWGVPIEAMGFNGIGCFMAGIIFQSPHHIWRSPFVFWLAAVPVHFLLQRLTAFDFLIFHTLKLRLMRLPFGSFLASYPEGAPESAEEIAGL